MVCRAEFHGWRMHLGSWMDSTHKSLDYRLKQLASTIFCAFPMCTWCIHNSKYASYLQTMNQFLIQRPFTSMFQKMHMMKVFPTQKKYVKTQKSISIFSQNIDDFEKHVQTLESVHPLISKCRQAVEKPRLPLVFSTCLSVFRNQRKNTYSCLNYYFTVSQKRKNLPRLFQPKIWLTQPISPQYTN